MLLVLSKVDIPGETILQLIEDFTRASGRYDSFRKANGSEQAWLHLTRHKHLLAVKKFFLKSYNARFADQQAGFLWCSCVAHEVHKSTVRERSEFQWFGFGSGLFFRKCVESFVAIQFFCKRVHSAGRQHNRWSGRPLHQGAAVMTVVITIFVQYLVTHAILPLTKLVLDSRSRWIGVVSSRPHDAQFKVGRELRP